MISHEDLDTLHQGNVILFLKLNLFHQCKNYLKLLQNKWTGLLRVLKHGNKGDESLQEKIAKLDTFGYRSKVFDTFEYYMFIWVIFRQSPVKVAKSINVVHADSLKAKSCLFHL